MKRILAIFAAIILTITGFLPVCAAAGSPPVIESEAAVLMDAQTGQVLFQKNMHEQLYPASITKIMTVLLGLENSSLNDIITMSREAVFSIERGSSHIALDTDEQITMEQALMAAMLPSANEASNGIAEHVSGSIPEFVKLMNQRAVLAGAQHTHFSNANGLCTADHVTSAYDMAMITKDALQYEQFRRIFGTMKYDIPPTNKQPEIRHLYTEHKMLPNGRYEYDGVIGGKTGYTYESQNTLVTAARRGERELITVVIKSQNNAVYTDTKALLDYGFDEFTAVPIILPAVIADNSGNILNKIKPAAKIVSQIGEVKYTRLLHKNVDRDDIAVAYTAFADSAEGSAALTISMHLQSPTDLMYADLGSITASAPVASPSLWSRAWHLFLFIFEIIIFAACALLTLRLFFTLRRKIYRKQRAASAGRINKVAFKYYDDRNR